MANTVLIVDMLKGFFRQEFPLYCGPDALKIIPEIKQLLEKEIAGGANLIYLVDTHDHDDKEFEMFPPHCVRGTEECDIIPELLDRFPGEIIQKSRFSGFYGTELGDRLKILKPEKIIMIGVCTDICILHTVADARDRDYRVEVPAACVASFDRDAHEWALKHMKKVLGAEIT